LLFLARSLHSPLRVSDSIPLVTGLHFRPSAGVKSGMIARNCEGQTRSFPQKTVLGSGAKCRGHAAVRLFLTSLPNDTWRPRRRPKVDVPRISTPRDPL